MRVAIIHDWIDTYRGGEKVLEHLADLYPKAPIFTLFYDPSSIPASLKQRDIRVLKGLNRFRRFRKFLLPILPAMIETIELGDFDLIISSSSCVAKGVIPAPEAKHICYIHSPMRYIWDQRSEYFKGFRKLPLLGTIIDLGLNFLRVWDTASSTRVDLFIANSNFVKKRVHKFYGRNADVVFPPVDLDRFKQKSAKPSNHQPYYIAAGALVPYKRFDLAIEASKKANVKLIIAGSGPEEKNLRNLVSEHDEVEFQISPDSKQWRDLLANAEALLFAGVEDFGMVPIEAMACGTPVIAFHRGGAADYVTPGINGELFTRQSAESLADVLETFDAESYDKASVTNSTERFSSQAFTEAMRSKIEALLGENNS